MITTRGGKTRRQAELRAKYEAAVESLMDEISAGDKETFSSLELQNMGVDLIPFDLEDNEFLESYACLFQPRSTEFIADYHVEMSQVSGQGALSALEFPDFSPDGDKLLSTPLKAADQIFMGDDPFYEMDGWYPRPFNKTSMPDWEYLKLVQYYSKDLEIVKTIPHVQLFMANEFVVQDNNIESALLPGEIGPVAQAIQARLRQTEFQKTSLFPVQVFSFFGPRHGRIIQAHFNPSGRLVMRVSQTYSFERKDEDLARRFLCFRMCQPGAGEKYEFHTDQGSPGIPQSLSSPMQENMNSHLPVSLPARAARMVI
ncbi:hypothetical protein ASPZODRAFT_18025 [Penicilliopsis zonata CBS 506.65]|uniref:Uncharacterized protein n=1 Tax=Penicilliopsis zonata CBS 506.65 TaxID=1073090 RepID=A0A1L9SD10_9EURO|nr:hypothetical protein ASPZODRAFT_18025 [Penicilliopsis zonata CBS 506.65]OJJ45115.1 hypothetical protein ASPZODRAFT_18025 [Penicilliopsis zonata CBS 506.65]